MSNEEIKRYDPGTCYDTVVMEEDSLGDYVKYDDHVAAIRALASQPAAPVQPEMDEDPMDIVRTLVCIADRMAGLTEEQRELYPSPTSEFSPLMQAARRACVERGYTEGGLAVEGVTYPAAPPVQQPGDVREDILGAVARGWCAPENAGKVMDEALAFAIAREVQALATTRPSAALTEDALRAAMKKAFSFGQNYWQQADSDFASQHKKADVTRNKFIQLTEDTCAALVASGCAPAPQAAPMFDTFDNILKIQRSEAETGDPYMVGLYNGMAMMCSNVDGVAFDPMACRPELDLLAASSGAVAVPDERHAGALHEVLQLACKELPDGYSIRVDVERDAGSVEWIDPDGNVHQVDGEGYLSDDVTEALEHIVQAAAPATPAQGQTK